MGNFYKKECLFYDLKANQSIRFTSEFGEIDFFTNQIQVEIYDIFANIKIDNFPTTVHVLKNNTPSNYTTFEYKIFQNFKSIKFIFSSQDVILENINSRIL